MSNQMLNKLFLGGIPLSSATCTALEIQMQPANDQRGKRLPNLRGFRSNTGTVDDRRLLEFIGAQGQVSWLDLRLELTDASTRQAIGSLSGKGVLLKAAGDENGVQRGQSFTIGVEAGVYTPANGGAGPALHVLTAGSAAGADADSAGSAAPAAGAGQSTASFTNFGSASLGFAALPGDLWLSWGALRSTDQRGGPVGQLTAAGVTLKRVFYRPVAGPDGGPGPIGNGELRLLSVVHAACRQGFDARESNANPPTLTVALRDAVGGPLDTLTFTRVLPDSYVLDLVGGMETLTMTSLGGFRMQQPDGGEAQVQLAGGAN
jgi:hypothetical protein